MAVSNHLINKCNQTIWQMRNQIIKHQMQKVTRLVSEVSVLFFQIIGVCCTW